MAQLISFRPLVYLVSVLFLTASDFHDVRYRETLRQLPRFSEHSAVPTYTYRIRQNFCPVSPRLPELPLRTRKPTLALSLQHSVLNPNTTTLIYAARSVPAPIIKLPSPTKKPKLMSSPWAVSLQCPKCNGVPNTLLPKDVCNPESSSTVLQCYIEHDQELPLEAAALPFERDASSLRFADVQQRFSSFYTFLCLTHSKCWICRALQHTFPHSGDASQGVATLGYVAGFGLRYLTGDLEASLVRWVQLNSVGILPVLFLHTIIALFLKFSLADSIRRLMTSCHNRFKTEENDFRRITTTVTDLTRFLEKEVKRSTAFQEQLLQSLTQCQSNPPASPWPAEPRSHTLASKQHNDGSPRPFEPVLVQSFLLRIDAITKETCAMVESAEHLRQHFHIFATFVAELVASVTTKRLNVYDAMQHRNTSKHNQRFTLYSLKNDFLYSNESAAYNTPRFRTDAVTDSDVSQHPSEGVPYQTKQGHEISARFYRSDTMVVCVHPFQMKKVVF